jgi:hypothetical protein
MCAWGSLQHARTVNATAKASVTVQGGTATDCQHSMQSEVSNDKYTYDIAAWQFLRPAAPVHTGSNHNLFCQLFQSACVEYNLSKHQRCALLPKTDPTAHLPLSAKFTSKCTILFKSLGGQRNTGTTVVVPALETFGPEQHTTNHTPTNTSIVL